MRNQRLWLEAKMRFEMMAVFVDAKRAKESCYGNANKENLVSTDIRDGF